MEGRPVTVLGHVAHVPGDQCLDLSRYRGSHMRIVVRVWTIDLSDQAPVVFCWNAGVGEEFPNCGGNRGRRVGGTPMFPDYDMLPLIEKLAAMSAIRRRPSALRSRRAWNASTSSSLTRR
jgi:hypothetical protein